MLKLVDDMPMEEWHKAIVLRMNNYPSWRDGNFPSFTQVSGRLMNSATDDQLSKRVAI